MTTPDVPPVGLRERKNRRTRLAIVRATAELTLEESYAAATIARIAARADIAPRTVSTWFPSKDDILFDGSDEAIERGITHLRSGRGDIVDRIDAWLTGEERLHDDDPEVARLVSEALRHDPELRARYHLLFGRFAAAVAEATAEFTGAADDDLGPALFAGAVLTFLERRASMATSAAPRERHGHEVTSGMAYLRAAFAAVNP